MIDWLAVVRAIHLAATIVAAGTVFFERMVAGPLLDRQAVSIRYRSSLHRWVAVALAIAALSGAAWALLVAMQLGEASASQVLTDSTLSTLLTDTRFGQVWLWRAFFLTLVAAALTSASAAIGWIRIFAAAALLAAVAWTGHAGARIGPVGWLQLCADMAHLLAAGLWLGSLPALAMLLATPFPSRLFTIATRRFSTFGMIAVAALLLTGLLNTYLLTDSILALPETTYGQLLLLKLALFGAMLALAAVNKWRWTPRLPAPVATTAIRRHSLIEAGLGLAVIVVVGVLGTLPPPLHRHVHASGAADDAFVHIHDVRGMADVKIGADGDAEIRLMNEDFSVLPAEAVSVRLSQPGQKPLELEAQLAADGLWRAAAVAIPAAGVWTIAVIVRRPGQTPLVLDGPIGIPPL